MQRHWYIKNCRLFETLLPEQLDRLERRARVCKLPKKTPVYLPSDAADGVLLLADGRVKLCSTTSEGKRAILAFIEAGEIFGELSLVGESEREEHAETVLASTIVLLPGDDLRELMAESAELTLGVTKLIGWRRKRIERRLKTLLFQSNRERLIYLLLDLGEQYGESTAEGLLLSIRLSHQDLASIIGTTRESVTVLLGELQLDGHLKVGRQRIVLKDINRLARCVGMAPQARRDAAGDISASPARASLPLRHQQ